MEECKKSGKVASRASRIFLIVLTPALGALIYSFLHLTGAIHSQTILQHYGIPLGVFPKTSTDYMFSAYSALLQTGLNWINIVRDPEIVLSMLALTTLVTAEIVLLNWLPKSYLAGALDGLTGTRWIVRIPASILISSGSIVLALLAIPFAANLILLVPAFIGVNSAKTSYKRTDSLYDQGCHKSTEAFNQCVAVYDDDRLIAMGFIIDSSATHLALYLNGKATILPVKSYRVETVPPINETLEAP